MCFPGPVRRALPSRPTPFLLTTALLLGLPSVLSSAQTARPPRVAAVATDDDLGAQARRVLAFGPRVVGSPANEQARAYLEGQFRALGYQTRREEFRYRRLNDLGSTVTVPPATPGGPAQILSGRALQGSTGGQVTAEAVRVPGTGVDSDFLNVNVRGRVAVIERSDLPLITPVLNAMIAGAFAVVLAGPDDTVHGGRLGLRLDFPVLAVSRSTAQAMTTGQAVTVAVHVAPAEARAVNLVAFRPAAAPPSVLIGAHLDSVHLSPGANDNLSGTLAVLDIARRAANTPVSARSVFVLFDAEEDGLLGSQHFVKSNWALVTQLRGMLNFDMVGLPARPLELRGQRPLVQVAREVTGVPSEEGVTGSSDHAPFREAGVPTLYFHRGLDPTYHQPGDVALDLGLVREAAGAGWRVALRLLRLPLP